MRILAFTDPHGSKRAFFTIRKKAKKADIVICAGDFTMFSYGIFFILKFMNKFNKPVLLVHGNHEDEKVLRKLSGRFKNIFFIHKGSLSLNNILFLGYGGGGFSIADKGFIRIEKRFEKKIKRHKGKVILITHAPPYKTRLDKVLDQHCGSKSITNFIKKTKPDICICGHLHENNNKHDFIRKTLIINPGPYGKMIKI